MCGIKFYSEFDLACGWELEKIIDKINKKHSSEEQGINYILEYYNIVEYLKIDRFKEYIEKETGIDAHVYEKSIKSKIGRFVGKNKTSYLEHYNEVDIDYNDDFFVLLEEYKIYKYIESEQFALFLEKPNMYINAILSNRKTVKEFDKIIRVHLLQHYDYAPIILAIHLKEEKLYLPESLTNGDKVKILIGYIESNEVNINYLRKIVTFPSNNELKINDKVKFMAKKRSEKEEEKIFNNNGVIEMGVDLSYPIDQDEVVKRDIIDLVAKVSIKRRWIEDNLDFSTLWNNFIYLYEFVDTKMILTLDSKKSELGTLESIIVQQGEHIYPISYSFKMKEMLSNAEIISYINILEMYEIKFEDMIKWFFHKYLLEEFGIKDFLVKMPSHNSHYLDKCTTILPQIDRILKQYNMYIEDGYINQELLQMSSCHLFFKDCQSLNNRKYIYSSSEFYKTASYLLFSDQSSIFHLPNIEEKYSNFYELIISKKVRLEEFKELQIYKIKWLIDNDLLKEDLDGHLCFNIKKVVIIKDLYYKGAISYWHYSIELRQLLDEFIENGILYEESTLFTKKEQDYLNFYLNKAKFSNGHEIRNKYLHGTNTNDEAQYKMDYYTILKLLVIIVIKINDDLCINAGDR